ncbi:hypothetical protein EU800_19655 [Tropicimonas sp. IMCC6043]|nr:hypothetical protein EU800_19655 [Tropicimonas sp. IMCC6043]
MPGRASAKHVRLFYEIFECWAKSWYKPRRVVVKIEWRAGELFPRVGFVVTILRREPEWVIDFFNRRGTAEQHIREGKYAIHWTQLSCRHFCHNEVRVQFYALADIGRLRRAADLPPVCRSSNSTSLSTELSGVAPVGRSTAGEQHPLAADKRHVLAATPNFEKCQALGGIDLDQRAIPKLP